MRTVVVALAVACLPFCSEPATAAPGEHHISGNVVAADGGGLPEVYVDFYRDDGSGNFVFYTPDDDPDPQFSQALPDGRYKVEISTADPESFQDEWYDDQHSKAAATVVTLDGADVVLDDVVIEKQPTLTGRVVDEAGDPVPGIRVFALDADTFNAAWPVWTEDDGTFESQVYPGDWTVAFDDDGADTYASEYLGDANSEETGTVVSTQNGATDVGTVVMSEGGSISGTVTGPDGLPMRDYHVTATAHSTEPVDDWTDRDGHYELPRLTPGDYQVRFDDHDAGNFVTQFNGGAADQASADPVTVIDHGTTPDVDASLTAIPHPAPPGVDMTGRVTDSSGHGVPGAHVFAFAGDIQDTWDQEFYEKVHTDATGRYYLSHLDGRDVSTFKIEASSGPGDWDDDDYLLAAQWYAGVSGATAVEDAVAVAVLPGAPVTADITLPDAGLLHGRTYTTGGTGYPGNADGDLVAHDQHGHWVDTAYIYSDVWRFYGGMAPGTYHLDPYGIGCPGGSLSIDVVVQSLQDTNVPGAAFCRPRATVAPSILGSPTVGEVLTVDPGQGSAGSVVTGYAWLVDGTVAGTGPSYPVPSQDAGHQVAVRVTRRTDFACCSHVEGTATSAAVTVPVAAVPPPPPPPPPPASAPQTAVASSVSVTPHVRRHQPRVTLRIAVTTAGVAAAGEVTIHEGARSWASRPLINGLLVLRVRGAKPGRHTYTVTYAGTDGVLPSTATVTVRVRRPHSAG